MRKENNWQRKWQWVGALIEKVTLVNHVALKISRGRVFMPRKEPMQRPLGIRPFFQSRNPVQLLHSEGEEGNVRAKSSLVPLGEPSIPSTLPSAPQATSILSYPLVSFWAPRFQLLHCKAFVFSWHPFWKLWPLSRQLSPLPSLLHPPPTGCYQISAPSPAQPSFSEVFPTQLLQLFKRAHWFNPP